MPRVAVAPPPGVVRDATPSATPGRWWDANLMRWVGNVLQPVGGWRAVGSAVFPTAVREMLTWRDNSGERWAAVGCDDGSAWAYSFALDTAYPLLATAFPPLEKPGQATGYGIGTYGSDVYGLDRASQATDDGERNFGDWWTFASWGEDLLFVCTTNGKLWRWSPATPETPAAIVSNAPIDNRGVLVTSQRHVVLLGAGGDPRSVKWCSQEDPTDWTPSPTNTAGGYQVETKGLLVCGANTREGVLLLTDTDAHLMRYLGAPYVYSINKVGDACGPIGPRAVVATAAITMWMGIEGFFVWNGQPTPLPCDVQDYVFGGMNPDISPLSFGSSISTFREIWFFYPDEAALDCSRYVVWNYAENWWSIGKLARTAADPSGSIDRPIFGASDGRLYAHEQGWLDNEASRIGQVYAETGTMTLGEGDRIGHVMGVVPDLRSDLGAAAFRFFASYEANGPETEHGPFDGVTRGDGLITGPRFSARNVRMRVEAMRDAPIRVGRTRLEIVPGGRR